MRKLISFCVMCLATLTMNAQKCAVLEFRGSASVSVADIDGISEMFMTYFRPAGYTMIERAQIDKVISEQQFQRSNITDSQAVQLGKILNASIVVVGKVSKLGGGYQVDARVVDVQSGHDVALEGATFTGDYRTNVKYLATKLAGKIAISSGGTVQVVQTSTPPQRTKVEIVYGYLKVFPNELGAFESEPTSIIAQINKQAMHGFNNWRIPTNEELSLLRANGYLGNGHYMSCERGNGIVLLVSDGEDYATMQAEEQARIKTEQELKEREQARIKAEQEAKRALLQQKTAIKSQQGYVNLGLASGTLWSAQIVSSNRFYTYEYALSSFGNSLPTKEQFEELQNSCKWTWVEDGYIITGTNGNSIFLPAVGVYLPGGTMCCVGSDCYYWSSTPNGSGKAWFLYINWSEVYMKNECRNFAHSVLLVKNP